MPKPLPLLLMCPVGGLPCVLEWSPVSVEILSLLFWGLELSNSEIILLKLSPLMEIDIVRVRPGE